LYAASFRASISGPDGSSLPPIVASTKRQSAAYCRAFYVIKETYFLSADRGKKSKCRAAKMAECADDDCGQQRS